MMNMDVRYILVVDYEHHLLFKIYIFIPRFSPKTIQGNLYQTTCVCVCVHFLKTEIEPKSHEKEKGVNMSTTDTDIGTSMQPRQKVKHNELHNTSLVKGYVTILQKR